MALDHFQFNSCLLAHLSDKVLLHVVKLFIARVLLLHKAKRVKVAV